MTLHSALEALGDPRAEAALLDSTAVRAQRCSPVGPQKGCRARPGCSRGGPGSTARALTGRRGRPLKLMLSAANRHDSPMAWELLKGWPPPRWLAAGPGYDLEALRLWLRQRGAQPVTPFRSSRAGQDPMTRSPARPEMPSNAVSPGSRTSGEGPLAMTAVPTAFLPRPHLPPPHVSGFKPEL